MKNSFKAGLLMACVAAISVGIGIANAADPASAPAGTPFNSDRAAAEHVSSLGFGTSPATPLAPATTADLQALRSHAEFVPRDGRDRGPNVDSINSVLDGARTLFSDEKHGRVAAVASASGDVCFTTQSASKHDFRGTVCTKGFDETGLTWGLGHVEDQFELRGLAVDGVTSIRINAGGTWSNAILANNAFVWNGENRPESINVVRDGATFEFVLPEPVR